MENFFFTHDPYNDHTKTVGYLFLFGHFRYLQNVNYNLQTASHLTFENVVRDGTTGEQGLCKEETKELRIGGG